MLKVLRQPAGRDRGGVVADHRVPRGGPFDVGEHRPLDARLLQRRLLDRSALGIAPARLSAAPRVGTDQVSRSACERSLPLELCRLGAQPIEVQVGQLGLRVDDHHVQTGDGQDPGYAAAPVTGTDHGDLGDLSSHDGHTPRP